MARGAKVAPSGDGGKETKESTYKKVNETSETAIEVKSSEKKKGQKIKGEEKYEGVKGEESIGENDDEKHSKKKNDNKKKNKDKGKKDTEVKEGEQEEEEEEEEDDGDGRILEPLQIETTEFDMERARQVLTGTNERDVEALAGMLDEKAQKRLKKIQEKRRAKKEKEEDAKQYVSHSPVADKDILGSVGPIRKGEGTKKKKKPTINLTNNADADYIKQFKRSLMQRPSKKRAKEHRNDNVPRDKTNSGRLVPCNVKSFPDFRFGEFGVGHKAYFFMIKKMLLILSIMLAYSVPLLILYVGAEYFGQGSPSASMTMGNIGPAKDVNGTALEVSFFGSEVSRSSLCFVAVLADLLIVVLVGWRISKLAAAQLREDKLLKEREDNVQLYTVWVKDVPPEANDEFLYKNFFRARGGPVQNIEIIMDTENLLDLMMQRGEIAVLQREAAYAKDENRLNKLSTRRKNLEDEIKEVLERCEAEPKCLGAFVSFQDEYSRNNCLKMYTIAGRKLKYPKQLHLKEQQITVMPAPPPEDILFPNLTVTAKERKIRRVISISLQTIISLVLLGILVYLKSSTDNFKEEMTQCAGLDVSLEDAEANEDIAVCYCKTIGVDELLLGSSSDVCADYVTFQQSLYQIAFAVLVFNSIATNLARRFAAFERHEQLSVREMSTTWTLFVFLFLNTSILMFAVDARITTVAELLPFSPIFAGDFAEATPEWYAIVGQSIVIFFIITFAYPAAVCCKPSCYQCRQNKKCWDKCCKCCCCEPEARTQYMLNTQMYGPEWQVAERYAVLMNIFFTAFVYMTALPVVPLLSLGYLIVTYYVDRYAFLRYYKKPRKLNFDIPVMVIKILPWAIILHALASMWFFSSPTWTPAPLPSSLASAENVMETLRLGHLANFQSFFFFAVAVLMGVYILYEKFRGSCAHHSRWLEFQYMTDDPEDMNAAKEKTYEESVDKNQGSFGSYKVTDGLEYFKAFLKFEAWPGEEEKKDDKKQDSKEKDEKKNEDNTVTAEELSKAMAKADEQDAKNKEKLKEMRAKLQDGETIVEMAPHGFLQYVMVPCKKCKRQFTIGDEGYAKEYNCPFCGRSSLY